VTNLSAADTRAITDAYRAEWRKLGNEAEDLPLMGATRHIVVAPTDAEALEAARPAYKKWQASYLYLWNRMGGRPRGTTYLHDFDHLLKEGVAIAGSAETVRKRLAEQVEAGGLNYMVCRFMFGDMPTQTAMRSVELFKRDVMPAFAG
jgi:alkanesulfonate monooxygenase SsuD/methylene tetrahydromethanopterin reductase-like flavin-dependent oxidoreductase (luciferase family)